MKKWFALFCAVLVLLSLVGCAQQNPSVSGESKETAAPTVPDGEKPTTPAPSAPTTAPTEPTTPPITEPQIIELTVDNVKDYLLFSLKAEDVKVESIGYNGLDKGNGTLVVKSSAKKDVIFNDVKLTVSFVTSSSGWGTLQDREIEIPFDGDTENNFSIYSKIEDYVSKSPRYKIEVTAVTGTVTLK